MKPMELTGRKFGRLTVIKRSYPNNKGGNTNWLCKCSCGTEKIILGQSLKRGYAQSCGCSRKGINALTLGLANMRALIGNYKKGAKRRGYEYNLTTEQFVELTQKDCYYCGVKPNNKYHTKVNNGDYIYNGIDRINNSKGYTIKNTVPCCGVCNRAKYKLTPQEFKEWVGKIYNKMYKGNNK